MTVGSGAGLRAGKGAQVAGEWIPMDISLDTKPEVQELVDLTGEPVDAVVFRLFKLWGWASLNTADGTARATPARLARICGGSEAFWKCVEEVGWIAFDGDTLTIPKWEERFSMAAKARAVDRNRKKAARNTDVREVSGKCPNELGKNSDHKTGQDRTGQDKRDIPAAPVPTSRPKTAATPVPKVAWTADAGWQGISEADRREWSEAFPGAAIDQELAKATAWLRANPTKAGKRNWRRFVVGWLQRCQDRGGTSREPAMRPGDRPVVVRIPRPDLGGQVMSDEEYARERRRIRQQAELRAERERADREREAARTG